MEVYKIKFKNVADLICHVISATTILLPFYTLNFYKGYVYFTEFIGECAVIYYTKSEITPSVYIFDATNFSLKKHQGIPKFTEQNQYIIYINEVEKDDLFEQEIENLTE